MARHTRIPTLMLALGLIIPLAACGADTGAGDTMDGLAKAVNALTRPPSTGSAPAPAESAP